MVMKRLAPAQIALLKMVRTGLRTREPGQVAKLEELVRQEYLSRQEPEPVSPGNCEPLRRYALTAAGEAVLAKEKQQ